MTGDATSHLWFGTFASFNRAFWPDIQAASGQLKLAATDPSYSIQGASRGKIFRRDGDSINSLAALQQFMRYNKWQTDPFSEGDASESISARYDLQATDASAGGAIDAKCVSSMLLHNMKVMAISGPTWDQQPTFVWSKFNDTAVPLTPHYGQPDAFQFPWVQMSNGLNEHTEL